MEGIFMIKNKLDHILFDIGASHSYTTQKFVSALAFTLIVLQIPLEISSPIDKAMIF